jgi:type II secretory pathway component GspD/PulD (secretin)
VSTQVAVRFLGLFFAASYFLLGSARLANAQNSDVARLVHPELAERLSLSDQQRAQVQQLLQKRAESLAIAADQAAKDAVSNDFEKQILATLSEEQRTAYTAVQPPQKLMFQFREMKWEDVLNWFAGQQDLTLVMDRTPPGDFTYSDTRSYSPSEGIDLLNSVLMTRGFTLVKRAKMLVVMELSDTIPLELLPRVTIEQLSERGRFEIVSVIFPLSGRPIDAVLAEVKPYLSSYGRAIPLSRSSQLLVIETAGKMQTINELIASVPIPQPPPQPAKPVPPPQPVFAAYPLGDLDAQAVLLTVQKLIPSEQITVDPKAKVLSAYVIPDQQTAIKAAIEQMMSSAEGGGSAAESSAYRFAGILPDELKTQILSVAPQAIVSATTDRVLVTASTEDQLLVRAALAALGIEAVTAETSMQVFEIDPTNAELVAVALRSFLPSSQIASNAQVGSVIVRGSADDLRIASEILEIWKQAKATAQLELRSFPLDRVANAEWLATVSRIVPAATTWLGDKGQQLMILARAEEITAIEKILPQLLSVLPKADARQLQIYVLTKNQQARRSSLSDLPASLADLKLVDGSLGSGEVLVWATGEQHAEFAEILEQLDQPTLPPARTVPKSYELTVQDAAIVSQLLAAEFPAARLSLNTAGDQLTALADEESQTQIAARVADFNAQLPSRVDRLLQTYSVPGIAAAALQVSLTPLLGTAQVTIDAERNRLLVWTDAQTHAELTDLVRTMSEEPAVEQQKVVVAYSLLHGTASNAKTVLDQIVRDALILADDKIQQIVVTAPLATQATVKATLAQIDQPGASPQQAEIQSYAVEHLQASVLVPTLQTMWPDMQLSADITANRILASGPAKQQAELREALERLLSASEAEPHMVHTYAVPSGEMSTLTTILSQIAPKALISTDPVSRTVTVWATEGQQTRVQQALEQIAKTAQNVKEPATYLVKPTQLIAVQTSLQSLFPGIGVAADATTGQLIVLAAAETQTRVAAVIELMSNGPDTAEKTTKVFQIDPLQLELADLLSALLSTAPAQVRIESNPANNTLIAIGTEADLAEVTLQIEQLQQQLPKPVAKTSAVYQLQHADSATAMTILAALVPKATLAQNVASKTIAASAEADEHQKIAEFLKAYDLPKQSNLETRVYRLQQGSARGLASVLDELIPEATLYGSREVGVLIATATLEQHERIAAIVKDYDIGSANSETRVFSIGKGNVQSLQKAVQALSVEASVSADIATNTLIVSATPEEIERIAKVIEQVESGGGEPLSTRFYALLASEPTALSRTLGASFPKATFAADTTGGGIFATASELEHQALAEVIDGLNAQPTRLPTLKSFTLQHTSPELVAEAIEDAFGRRTSAGVSFNRETKSVFVVGSAQDLLVAEQLVRQIDVPRIAKEARKLRVFSLGGADGRSVTQAIEGLFEEAVTAVDVRYDTLNEQLLVIGDPEQLQLVEETMEQFAPPERELEIIQLHETDPYSFKQAADALFEDEPLNAAPSITIDSDQQQVLVRATEEQLQRIQQLLQQMGEPVRLSAGRPGLGRLRFVPVHRNSEKLLEELRRLWPTVRDNPLNIVDPNQLRAPEPKKANDASTEPSAASQGPNSTPQPFTVRSEQQVLLAESSDVPQVARLTSAQSSEKSAAPLNQSAKLPAADSPPLPATVPPIVVVLGEDQWTLASDDLQALDQFQRLLDSVMSPKVEPFATTGNFSVYLLENAGAQEVQELLTDLFRTGGRSSSSALSTLFQRVKIVSDSRINALIVSGSRADRRVVEELLGVLDSEDLIDTLQEITPTMVTLQNANAENVVDIISDVYKSQISAGGGRRPVAIPEGVSSEVASVLQQINAQASGPLLTLSVDANTNSIVIRAPAELSMELLSFIEKLDQNAAMAPSSRVDVIHLESTNAKNLEKALKILLSR